MSNFEQIPGVRIRIIHYITPIDVSGPRGAFMAAQQSAAFEVPLPQVRKDAGAQSQ